MNFFGHISDWPNRWSQRSAGQYYKGFFLIIRLSYVIGCVIALTLIKSVYFDWNTEEARLFSALVIAGFIVPMLFSFFWKERLLSSVYRSLRRADNTEQKTETGRLMEMLFRFSGRMAVRESLTGAGFVIATILIMTLTTSVSEAVYTVGMIYIILTGWGVVIMLNVIFYDLYTMPLLAIIKREYPDSRLKEYRFAEIKYLYFFILSGMTVLCYDLYMRTAYSTGLDVPAVSSAVVPALAWSVIFAFMILRSWLSGRHFYEVVNLMADGERPAELPPGLAEYFMIWDAMEAVVSQFEKILRHIQNNSSELEAAARVVGETAAAQNMALVRQSTSVTQTSSTLQELVQASQQVAESATAVVSFAEDTEKQAEEGLAIMQESVQKVQLVRSGNEASLSDVITLSEAIIEIESVLNFIISIADETNLIALNAGIEASSAGESGKRFKVVANEVRNLSTRVTKSIRRIKSITRNIQDASTRMVETVENNQERIGQSVQWSLNTYQYLKDILDLARKSADAAKQIYVAIQQQKIANQQISLSFNDIAQDIQQLAQASDRYDQYVQALRKFSANIEETIDSLHLQTDANTL